MGYSVSCSPDNPCATCKLFLRQESYRNVQDKKLFHEWLFADQGMGDMDWEEYQQWHCPQCREWTRLRNNHHV